MKFRWAMKYAWLTLKHKWFLLLASRKTGVGLWQALIHDLSKFTPAELPAYGRQFCGDKGDPQGFARTWLHHQNTNPHHWEYWVPRTDHSQKPTVPARICCHDHAIDQNSIHRGDKELIPEFLTHVQARLVCDILNAPGPLPMPEKYVREMVADWMGASRAYTGSWDMRSWLDKNLPKMRLHPETRRLVNLVLSEVK